VLARAIVRPLRELTAAATRMAAGERRIDVGGMMRRNDETGALAQAFDAMAREVREREHEVNAKAGELSRSNQELSQFAYIASHDLQEPLRMVGSYLGLLARRYRGRLDAEADEFIGYAVDGAARMKRLINDLLGYSRVSNRPLSREAVDTGRIVEAAVRVLAERIAAAAAEITVEPLPKVDADPLQMERLFLNLIENAVRYHGEASPQVRVAAGRRDGFWEFSIADNGIGIAPEFKDKVFDIFARLNSREKYEGTGVGLASCRKIVERHGGSIWVEPAAGGGSVFRFTLPAIREGEED
ncbi:MAG: HAMP domain-containing protein, partial [Bauldia sp.]|nr:HAMP domain-containing protein [Bauldia sp.]